MIRIHLADRQRAPIGRRDECPERFHELRKPEPTMATNVLGHRQVKIVKDIHVNVDQQAVETLGPPLDDLASRASRICSHLRKPNQS